MFISHKELAKKHKWKSENLAILLMEEMKQMKYLNKIFSLFKCIFVLQKMK
jgi:hypothetical protein